MKTIKEVYIVSAITIMSFMVAACSTLKTTVIPQSQNKYTVEATAENSATVINGAIKKAQMICTNQNKKLMVLSHKTQYQGAGKTLGTVTNMVSKMAFATGDINVIPTTKTAEDYKSTVVFECQ